MGKKSSRPSKSKKKGKENTSSKHDSYSDDYRLTPDFLLQDVPSHCNAVDCCSRRRGSCPQGEFCCSRETCLSPERRPYYRVPSSSVSPIRDSRDEPYYEERDSRKLRKANMEVIVVSDRRLNVRKTPSAHGRGKKSHPYCSSCDSCESCASGGSSYTRIDLTNDLFTSPLQSTQASFYHADLARPNRHSSCSPSPERYPSNWGVQHRNRNSHSPTRRGGSCTADLRTHSPEDGYSRRKASPVLLKNKNGNPRARSYNEVRTVLENSERDRSEILPSRGKRRVSPSGKRNKISEEEKYKQRNKDRRLSSRSPTRSTQKTSDSGVEKSSRSGSSYTGRSRSQSSRSDERRELQRKGRMEKRREVKKDRNEVEENKENVRDSNQVNLLNKMVCQTREHRKQIKTLESELERLRSSGGDGLATCEVNQSDVEWRPGDVVGEGSFSTVYKGNYCGTEVAVKELKFKLSQDDKNYFRSESALLQQLHHPRVVLLMGVCTSSCRPFMLLEYLSGGTLHSFIHTSSRERLDHAAYFSIAKDVAQGLNYLHKHDPQVLHLDLKSMNVLLDSYARAKIADFGFSILRRSRGGGSAAQRGSIRGTPAWMAPELLTKGEVSTKCDVYSYAIILWEMLTASFPFQGLDIYHIMEAVEEGGRPPLPQTGVSSELRELIISCWAQNPSLRPSFEEILGALETAALPSSWRRILVKANIEPSALTDVNAARAILEMMERSSEVLKKSKIQLHRRAKSDETENEFSEKENFRRKIPRKNAIHDSLAITRPSRGRAITPKGKKHRPLSATREDYFEVKNRVRKSEIERQDRGPSGKGFVSPRREKRETDSDGRVLSPHRRRATSIETPDNRRQSRDRRRASKTRFSQREEIDSRRSYSRSPSKGRGSRKQERERNYGARAGGAQKDHLRWEKDELEEDSPNAESQFSEERYRQKDKRRVRRLTSSEEDAKHSRRGTDLSNGNSSDVLDSRISPRTSYKNSFARSNPRRSPSVTSPSRRPTRSPLRKARSPTRRNSSPEKGGNDHHHRRQEPSKPQRYGGIVLTADQLLSQKQRLRPVRPSALKDLSGLPQNSLNDISFILKQAMVQRRDALEQLHSVRGTAHSKDIEWSDLY